jgi:serine/threonine-protein kinase
MKESRYNLSQCPPPLADAINAIVKRAEGAWEAGRPPDLGGLLGAVEADGRPVAVWELLDLDCSRRGGQQLTEDDYLKQLPEDTAAVRDFFTDRRERQTVLPEIPGYRVLNVIACGGMGVVYRATRLGNGEEVALKMVLPGLAVDRAAIRRFRDEMEILASLDDPNVIRILEVGEHDGRPFYVMPLIKGGSLADHLHEWGLPRRETAVTRQELSRRLTAMAEFLAKVARGVRALHQAGVIHRDLKPSNILIDDNGEPLVADLGLAARPEGGEGLTRTGDVLGTPPYMAPEQARGEKPVRVLVDVYSLGAILYELLTGYRPFATPELVDQNQHPLPPSEVNPLVGSGSGLESVCLKCLKKNPADRYQSAEELARDLEACAAGRRPAAQPSWLSYVLEKIGPFRLSDEIAPHWGTHALAAAGLSVTFNAGMFILLTVGATPWVLWLWLLAAYYGAGWVCWYWFILRRSLNRQERDLVNLWVGNGVANGLAFAYFVPLFGDARATNLAGFYPFWALLDGLVFFAEGRLATGILFLIGTSYFGASILLNALPGYAPLLYACLDGVCLVWLGWHTRQRGSKRGSSEDAPSAARLIAPTVPLRS